MFYDPVLDYLAGLAVLLVCDVIFVYSAYLSLSVSRGLATPIYKSRALWTAILGLVLALTVTAPYVYAYPLVTGNPSESYSVAAQYATITIHSAAVLVLFVWIDRTINAGVRLDFYRRNLAGWKVGRYLFLGTAISNLVVGAPGFPQLLYVKLSFAAVLVLTLVYASFALIRGSVRAKDMTFRAHVKWAGYLFASLLLYVLLTGSTLVWVLNALPALLPALCVYKLSRHLVPSARLEAPGDAEPRRQM